MKIIISNSKLCFQLGANYYAAPFSFSQLTEGGTTVFQFISIEENLFNFKIPFSEIVDELNAPYASANDLRNVLLMYSGDSTDATTATINVYSLTENGSIIGGRSAISLTFRGANGTLNGVLVPDGYTFSGSTDGSRRLSGITYTVPTTGELRIIATTIS